MDKITNADWKRMCVGLPINNPNNYPVDMADFSSKDGEMGVKNRHADEDIELDSTFNFYGGV